MKEYVCECGRVFTEPNKFNGHKRNCLIHFAVSGKLDKLKEYVKQQKAASIRGGETRKKNVQIQKELKLEGWISEQHTCERCGKVMTEKFGSGRFCCKACANSHDKTEESKKKASESLKEKTKDSVIRRKETYYSNPKLCKVCGKVIPYEKRVNVCCCRGCANKIDSEKAKQRILEKGYNLKVTVKSKYKYGTYKGFYCDSSWELAFVIYCLDNNLDIKRNSTSFPYTLDGETRLYFPDFIVGDEDYYEIKGHYTEMDLAKIRDFPFRLTVIDNSSIKPYLNYCISLYGKEFYRLYDRDYPSWMDKEK